MAFTSQDTVEYKRQKVIGLIQAADRIECVRGDKPYEYSVYIVL